MVAGKVKMAMGLQKSPAPPNPKPKQNPKQKPYPDSSSQSQGPGFPRTLGSYFPRTSAQVQPRPPDVTELVRLVEQLRERESLLKTEILEQKLLKESVAILPVLESEISYKDSVIERSRRKIECLEAENERLRRENEILHMELSRQNGGYEERIKCMEDQMSELKKANDESLKQQDSCNPSRFMKNLRKYAISSSSGQGVYENLAANSKQNNGIEIERPRCSTYISDELAEISDGLMTVVRSRIPRVPKPPPRPLISSSFRGSSLSESSLPEISNIPSPPPPVKVSAPPPPPPPPLKGFKPMPAKVKRVPEVVEFYHSLMRRDSRKDSSSASGQSGNAEAPPAANKDMIGEIENRSAHLLAIKTDVETQGDFIRFLIKEVENAAFTDIEDVVPFVKWLDDELSYLVDERAVLKHFDWPEQKADTLREAAFGYCDLKKLLSDVSSFRDEDHRQTCTSSLKKMQALFEKLEHGIYSLSRLRESATNRFKRFHIPMAWMLDTGPVITQIKLASVKLGMKYMKRVSAELETVCGGGPEEEELMVQAVRFAFRVHQFAGGFDVETMRAFQELRDKARSCHVVQLMQ